MQRGTFDSVNHKLYPDLRGKQWWSGEMTAVFSGYLMTDFKIILIYNEVVISDPILVTVEKVISITVNLLLTILCRPDDNPQEVVLSFTVYSHLTTNNFAAKRLTRHQEITPK